MPSGTVKKYCAFLDSIPDAALLFDPAGRIIFANAHLASLLGYSPDELAGQPLETLVPGLRPQEHAARVNLVARHRDGRVVPVDIMLEPMSFGQRSLTLGVVRDVSGQRAFQAQLTDSEQYRQLVEHASDVFYAVDVGGDPLRVELRFLSHQAEALTGFPVEAFTREPHLGTQLIHPTDLEAVRSTTRNVVEHGESLTREYRVRHHPSGTYRWIEDRVVPIFGAEGRVAGYQGVVRDITDRWSQQRLAQTLAALGRSMRESESREDMIYRLLDALLTLVEANGAAFATYDAAADEVYFELGCGVLDRWTSRRVKAADAVSADVIRQGEPWVSNDVDHDPRLAASRRGLPDASKAYASIPMRHTDGRVIAALAVSRLTPFADHDIQALMVVGEMGAVVLERQMLHAQLLQSTAVLEETLEQTIEGWARALDMRDRSAGGHTSRVTDLTLRLAQQLGVAAEQLPHIRRGAMLHDIGKMVIPDAILRKPGPLTDDERVVMRRHVEHAYDMLWPIEFLRPALPIPAFHHERWDGGGYPRGLKGEEIPLPARIFAVADVYDAITSDRPYAAAESRDRALAFISAHRGSQFDGRVVDALLSMESGAGVLGVTHVPG